MKAVKKLLEVGKDKSITIKSLPFHAGEKVEVIVLSAKEEKDIFGFMDELVKKKKIVPKSLKEIEKIVHEVRGSKVTDNLVFDTNINDKSEKGMRYIQKVPE